jgi:hypothetical protein
MTTPAEKSAYAKGYAAGQRRAEREDRAVERVRSEDAFWRQVFCAALQGTLVNARWKTGEKHWEDAAAYAHGCGKIADEALRQHKHRA